MSPGFQRLYYRDRPVCIGCAEPIPVADQVRGLRVRCASCAAELLAARRAAAAEYHSERGQ